MNPNSGLRRRSNGNQSLRSRNNQSNSEASAASQQTENVQQENLLVRFCREGTIQGLKYLVDPTLPVTHKIFFGIWIVLGYGLCGLCIWPEVLQYLYGAIIISSYSGTVSVEQIAHPAVTICDLNLVKKSIAYQIEQGDNEGYKYFLNDTCFIDGNVYVPKDLEKETSIWKNYLNFKKKVTPSEMLYYCKWNNEVVNCSDIFEPILTDYGLCYTFNMAHQVIKSNDTTIKLDKSENQYLNWTPEYIFKKSDPYTAIPRRSHGTGIHHGLTVALDARINDYFCTWSNSIGFKMILHSPGEFPQIGKHGVLLHTQKRHAVMIKPMITDAEDRIRKRSPEVRQCYFTNERHLRYYNIYTRRNCELECQLNYTLHFCGCAPKYIPVTFDAKICRNLEQECARRLQKLINNKLADKNDYYREFKYNEVPDCKCFENCNNVGYEISSMSASMISSTIDVKNYKEKKLLKNDPVYFEENVAIVDLVFPHNNYMKDTRIEYYGFEQLLSNVSGLLGLFTGFSFITVAEALYYFLLKLFQ